MCVKERGEEGGKEGERCGKEVESNVNVCDVCVCVRERERDLEGVKADDNV